MNETATEWQCNDCEQWNTEEPKAKVNQDALYDQVADSMKVWLAANNMTMQQAYFSHEFLKEVVHLTEELGIEPEEDND
jgi:hypothetical protein